MDQEESEKEYRGKVNEDEDDAEEDYIEYDVFYNKYEIAEAKMVQKTNMFESIIADKVTGQEQFNKINIADFYPVDDNDYDDIRKQSIKEKKPPLDDNTPSSNNLPVKMTQAEVKEHHKKEEKNLQNEIEMMMMNMDPKSDKSKTKKEGDSSSKSSKNSKNTDLKSGKINLEESGSAMRMGSSKI